MPRQQGYSSYKQGLNKVTEKRLKCVQLSNFKLLTVDGTPEVWKKQCRGNNVKNAIISGDSMSVTKKEQKQNTAGFAGKDSFSV